MPRKSRKRIMKGILLVMLVTVLNGAGQLLQKIGMDSFRPDLFSIFTNPHLLAGIFLYALSALLLVYAFKHGPLSVLFPFVSLTFVWVIILSYLVLQEPVGLNEIIGTAAIIAGVSFVGST